MRTRGDTDDTIYVTSDSSGNGRVYFMVPCELYTLERSDGRAKAKI